MAKINISFKNTDYSIDESILSDVVVKLESQLSTTMGGTGAQINFGGTEYNIDSTKLNTTKDVLVTHIGTISGEGDKVVIGGIEYGIDSTKLANAVAELQAELDNLQSSGIISNFTLSDGSILITSDGKIFNIMEG